MGNNLYTIVKVKASCTIRDKYVDFPLVFKKYDDYLVHDIDISNVNSSSCMAFDRLLLISGLDYVHDEIVYSIKLYSMDNMSKFEELLLLTDGGACTDFKYDKDKLMEFFNGKY